MLEIEQQATSQEPGPDSFRPGFTIPHTLFDRIRRRGTNEPTAGMIRQRAEEYRRGEELSQLLEPAPFASEPPIIRSLERMADALDKGGTAEQIATRIMGEEDSAFDNFPPPDTLSPQYQSREAMAGLVRRVGRKGQPINRRTLAQAAREAQRDLEMAELDYGPIFRESEREVYRDFSDF